MFGFTTLRIHPCQNHAFSTMRSFVTQFDLSDPPHPVAKYASESFVAHQSLTQRCIRNHIEPILTLPDGNYYVAPALPNNVSVPFLRVFARRLTEALARAVFGLFCLDVPASQVL